MKRRTIPARWSAILHHLYRRGWVDIFDICPVFISNVKYAREVMQQLIRRGLITKITAPLFPESRGAGTAFYTLSKGGYSLLRGTARGFRPKTVPTSTHLMHYYLKNRFCTGLSLRYSAMSYTDLELQQLNQQELTSATSMIPDFLAIVNNSLILGEIDCATETLISQRSTLKTIEGKFRELKTLITPQFLQEWRVLSQTAIKRCCYLHVTTGSKKRVATIAEIASSTEPSLPILITTAEKIMPTISYDAHRYPSISYAPLFQGVWLALPNQDVTTLEQELNQ